MSTLPQLASEDNFRDHGLLNKASQAATKTYVEYHLKTFCKRLHWIADILSDYYAKCFRLRSVEDFQAVKYDDSSEVRALPLSLSAPTSRKSKICWWLSVYFLSPRKNSCPNANNT